MLDKVLGKIKEITSVEKLDNTKIMIDTDNKLPGDITLKNVMTHSIKLVVNFSH